MIRCLRLICENKQNRNMSRLLVRKRGRILLGTGCCGGYGDDYGETYEDGGGFGAASACRRRRGACGTLISALRMDRKDEEQEERRVSIHRRSLQYLFIAYLPVGCGRY
jgi:hypothetical protein